MSKDDYITRLSPIEALLSEFHVHTEVAFFFARPMFNHIIMLEQVMVIFNINSYSDDVYM